jgi:hypothetical protein
VTIFVKLSHDGSDFSQLIAVCDANPAEFHDDFHA